MRARFAWLIVLLATVAAAAPPRHVIAFGKWITVKWFLGAGQGPAVDIQVRPLYVDGRLREYALGEPHDVTDRVFVVQQAYRLNDSLPGERGPQWKWQPGGWLLVERATGQVRRLSLPDFDPFNSLARWYRDYAAYCGISEEDGKRYAMVTQLGRRKPLLRQEVAAACAGPEWQRDPVRVTFNLFGGKKQSYEVRGRAVDPAPPTESDDESKPEENP